MANRSAPDDDMMKDQQSRDLGHEEKMPPGKSRESEAEAIKNDARANRGVGGLFRKRGESETEKAIERAVNPRKR